MLGHTRETQFVDLLFFEMALEVFPRRFPSLEQALSLCHIITVPCGQQQAQKVSQYVYNRVNFGGETSFASSKCFLLLIPPFTPVLE